MIVAISRAVGETMVVFIAAGGNGIFNTDPLSQGQTITAAMASLGAGTDEVKAVVEAFRRPERSFLTPPSGVDLV